MVDCCGGHDPFNGDGYMAKGKHMARIAASNWAPAAALQQHLMAMAQYRCADPLHGHCPQAIALSSSLLFYAHVVSSCLPSACLEPLQVVHGCRLPVDRHTSPRVRGHTCLIARQRIPFTIGWIRVVLMDRDAFVLRGRQPVSRCRCIAALAACLQLVPEKDVDFPWLPVAASQLPGCKTGPLADKHQDLPEYLTWTLECCKHAQVVMPLHSMHLHACCFALAALLCLLHRLLDLCGHLVS